MLNKKGVLNFVIGLVIAILIIGFTVKIGSDILKNSIEQKNKESFLKLVSSVEKLNRGERNYEFLRLNREGTSLVGFARNDEPITFYNEFDQMYGYIMRPAQCQGIACLCYCTFIDVPDYQEKPPHYMACTKSLCKGLTTDIAKTYTQQDFKIPGTTKEKYRFENGFVIMQKVKMDTLIGGDLPFIHPLPAVGLPLGVELHFERGPDYTDFCFESKCI